MGSVYPTPALKRRRDTLLNRDELLFSSEIMDRGYEEDPLDTCMRAVLSARSLSFHSSRHKAELLQTTAALKHIHEHLAEKRHR